MHEELVLVVNDNVEKNLTDPFPLRALMICPIQLKGTLLVAQQVT